MFFLWCCQDLQNGVRVFSRLVETNENIQLNLHNLDWMSRILLNGGIKAMLIRDWLIFNWSQGPVPRTCSHEAPSKWLPGPVAATGPTNSNWFEFVGPILGPNLISVTGFLMKIGLFTSWELVPGTSPLVCCDLKNILHLSHSSLAWSIVWWEGIWG